MKLNIGDTITLYKGDTAYCKLYKISCIVNMLQELTPTESFKWRIYADCTYCNGSKKRHSYYVPIYTNDFVNFYSGHFSPSGGYTKDKYRAYETVSNRITEKINELNKKRAEVQKMFYLT